MPSDTPAVETVVAPTPVPEPVAPVEPAAITPEPVAETVAPEPAEPATDPAAAARDAAHAPGLLSASEPEAKPAEPVEPTKPVEAPSEPSEPAAVVEPLSYAEHKLTLPDGVAFEDARLGEYDAILGAHQIPPEARQQLADLYASDVQALLQNVRSQQYESWTETRKGWADDCRADPEFGGAAFETHRAAAIRMIEFVMPPEERAEFNTFLAATGAADHPQFFRFLNRLAQRFGEPAQPPSGIRPAPPQGAARPRSLREVYNRRRAGA